MNFEIKAIEDLSLNAWPSHQMQVYDGWILRFSYFYTHRTNSVEQIGRSTLPLEEKVTYCEEIYKRWHTPTIFKISPLANEKLVSLLISKEYHSEHRTNVMTLALDNTASMPADKMPAGMLIHNHIDLEWIEGLFTLKNTTNIIHRNIVPSMYAAIPKDVIAVSIQQNFRTIATGLGILDRDYIGIYAIHVHEDYRHRHYATAILKTLLSQGKARGASKAYLQVVSGNDSAIALYEGLGFEYLYEYHFLVNR